MTTVAPKPIVTRPWPVHQPVKGSAFARLLRTTDAKQIGLMYLITSFVFFMVGGFMALLMRAELARPGLQFLSPEQYNQLFTMHGTIMLLFFATPIVFAFANYITPLQIGAPDVSFPGSTRSPTGSTRSVARSRWSASSRRAAPPTSAGSPMPRSTASSTRPASAPTCGSSAWSSLASAPSSAPST